MTWTVICWLTRTVKCFKGSQMDASEWAIAEFLKDPAAHEFHLYTFDGRVTTHMGRLWKAEPTDPKQPTVYQPWDCWRIPAEVK